MVVQDRPHRAVTHLRVKLVRRLAQDAPSYSEDGGTGKPGTVQRRKARTTSVAWSPRRKLAIFHLKRACRSTRWPASSATRKDGSTRLRGARGSWVTGLSASSQFAAMAAQRDEIRFSAAQIGGSRQDRPHEMLETKRSRTGSGHHEYKLRTRNVVTGCEMLLAVPSWVRGYPRHRGLRRSGPRPSPMHRHFRPTGAPAH